MKTINFLFIFLISMFLVSNVCGYANDIVSDYFEIAVYEIYLNETFDFSDAYNLHGWNYAENDGGGCSESNPLSYGTNNYGYGFNQVSCGSAGWRYIKAGSDNRLNPSGPFTHQTILKFDLIGNITSISDTAVRWWDVDDNQLTCFDYPIIRMKPCTGGVYWLDCGYNIDGNGTFEVMYIMDEDTDISYAYVNGLLVCTGEWTTQSTANVTYMYQAITTGIANYIVDDIMIVRGRLGDSIGNVCAFPALFCDNFNYIDSLYYEKDWGVYKEDGTINFTLAPLNNELSLLSDSYLRLYHESADVEYGWEISEGTTAETGHYSSQFSSDFNFNLSSGSMIYESKDYKNSYKVYGINLTVNGSYIDLYRETPTGQSLLALNITTANNIHNFKVTSNWKHRSKFPFNSSFLNDSYIIYIDGYVKSEVVGFYNPSAENEYKRNFIKSPNCSIIIDDYYVYVGTDKNINTLSDVETYPLVPDVDTSDTDESSEEFSEVIGDIWADFGINTLASKIIFGMILLVAFNLMIGGFMISSHHFSVAGLGFLNVIFIILLAIIGLLPVWLIFLIVLIVIVTGLYLMSKAGG